MEFWNNQKKLIDSCIYKNVLVYVKYSNAVFSYVHKSVTIAICILKIHLYLIFMCNLRINKFLFLYFVRHVLLHEDILGYPDL